MAHSRQASGDSDGVTVEPATALSNTFLAFARSQRAAAALLIACTLLAIAVANSAAGPAVQAFWTTPVAGLRVVDWVNDALMAVFFLLVGLELERELYSGELSAPRKALLPIVAAIGGLLVPAGIHHLFNGGTPTSAGIGIPMATDIAFALGVLALLGDRVPPALKTFLAALAVIDDLAAMVLIALFYAHGVALGWLGGAFATLLALVLCGRAWRVQALWPYLLGGVLLWFCLLRSGVHPTLAGVALAFAIPYSSWPEDRASPSHRLEHALQVPVAVFVLPVFALANTGIVLQAGWHRALAEPNALGILGGLVLGKPLGIVLACALAVAAGICRLPIDVRWPHLVGAGLLGGIGFTMSIFIANLAFPADAALVDQSKAAVLLASLAAGVLGYLFLRVATKTRPPEGGLVEHDTVA
jgi:NhaA family Na+:H+ antiporter